MRKKIECEKKALSIVEQLLEENITEEFLLDSVGVACFYAILHLSVQLFFFFQVLGTICCSLK